MTRVFGLSAAILAMMVVAGPATAQSQVPVQTPAQANDERARLGRFQPPPPALPPTPQQNAPTDDTTVNGGPQQRRPWRELTDSLLELMAPRRLLAGSVLDDPLTTGFGNHDFVDAIPTIDPPGHGATAPAEPITPER